MSISAKQRVFFIGTGAIAKEHLKGALEVVTPEALEVHATDLNEKALDVFKEGYPALITHAHSQTMLTMPAFDNDIVIVSTPPKFHFALAKDALESGRHVVCEKPLVMSVEEANELLVLAKKTRRHLSCCSSRFIGCAFSRKIREVLQSGVLGDLYNVTWVSRGAQSRSGVEYQPETTWFTNKAISGGGVMMDWGPYDVAFLNYVLEPDAVEVASAWVATPTIESDSSQLMDVDFHFGANLRFELANGKSFNITYERSSLTHGTPFTLFEFEGLKGAISLEKWVFPPEDVIKLRHRQVKEDSEEVIEFATKDGDVFCHHRPLKFLIDHLNGQPSAALLNEEAAFNFKCIQAIYQAAKEKRSVRVERI